MIKFGRLTHPIKGIVSEIAVVKKMNLDYVELGIEGMNNSDAVQKRIKLIKNALRNFSNPAIAHTTWWYDLGSLHDIIRNAWIKQGQEDINVAHSLGVKLVNFHFTVISDNLLKNKKSRNIILNNYVKSLGYLVKYAAKKNIKIMLENGEEKFEYYKYILDRVPNLKVHLDVGHAFISGRMKNVNLFFLCFNKRIAHIHIHDNHGTSDEHLPLRKGKINWKRIAKLLKKYNYNKTITFEVFTSDKDLLKSKNYFQSLLN